MTLRSITQWKAVTAELRGVLSGGARVIYAWPDSVRLSGTSARVSMRGPKAGVFVETFVEFPDPLRVVFEGRVFVGAKVANPPSLSALEVQVHFAQSDNPSLNGEISMIVRPDADGRFEAAVVASFAPGPRQHTLKGTIKIRGTNAPVADTAMQLICPNLSWFVETIEPREAAAASSLEFVGAVRKVLNPAGEFDRVSFGRNAHVKPLFADDVYAAGRLKAGARLAVNGEMVTLSHVITGIEGGRRQDPKPPIGDMLRIDTLVTWAGDLGGALYKFLNAWYWDGDMSLDLPGFVAQTATRADLIGDIDGVNLSFSWDQSRPLSEQLRAYYEGPNAPARRRFSRFVEVTETDAGAGTRALAIEPGSNPPRLTAASRAFIEDQIRKVAIAGLIYVTAEQYKRDLDVLTQPLPVPVEAALGPNSQEIKGLADLFIGIVETGLANEPPP
ncbi:MAG TPA: hypothetical protein VF230_16770 [Acidimicrobiales bacterium]